MGGVRICCAGFAALFSIALLTAETLSAQVASPDVGSTINVSHQQPADNSPAAPTADDDLDDFLNLDIEQLRHTSVAPALEMVVTTVSRQESTVGRSPTAVFVITSEMVRRSGATSIPEVLRMVPGVEVARVDSDKWAVSVRGFNGRFSNKLLVQIDGRSVYLPTFAGVFWDEPDLLLEDIERIEVIRGPGATVWGANAVNGVINIITRRAEDTVGAYARAGGGSEDLGFTSARLGGRGAEGTLHWRLWGKWFERDSGLRAGEQTFDRWNQGRGGFRVDWTPGCSDMLTFQGEYYEGLSNGAREFTGVPGSRQEDNPRGGHLLGRWTRELSDESDLSLQLYVDRTERTGAVDVNGRHDTFDLDFQHSFRWGSRQQIIWGLDYRQISDRLVPLPGSPISFVPAKRNTNLFSAFVQDEVMLLDDHLYFTIGTKLEDNDFTGFEVQPTARVLWSPDPTRAAWAAVSRAVRTPSRLEDDVRVALGGPAFLIGSRDVVSEEVLAYEVGYRGQPVERFSWDVALFYNVYDDLVTTSPAFPNLLYTNDMGGETYGVELFSHLEVTPCWRLSASYTFLRMHLHPGPTSSATGETTEGASPRNQASIRSAWDLGRDWEVDLAARYVDHLPARLTPSYITMDLRLGWRPTDGLELAVVGQNLLDAAHKEFDGTQDLVRFTEIQRAVYGSLTWRY